MAQDDQEEEEYSPRTLELLDESYPPQFDLDNNNV